MPISLSRWAHATMTALRVIRSALPRQPHVSSTSTLIQSKSPKSCLDASWGSSVTSKRHSWRCSVGLQSAPLDFPRWRHAITEIVKQYPSTYARRPEWLQAQYALEVLNDVVQQQAAHTGQQVTYTTEVGDHQMWAGQYVALQDGWQFITSSGQGAMGSGLPMAIGAQLAHPASLVICLAGDGSLRFSEAELETIWEYRPPRQNAGVQ